MNSIGEKIGFQFMVVLLIATAIMLNNAFAIKNQSTKNGTNSVKILKPNIGEVSNKILSWQFEKIRIWRINPISNGKESYKYNLEIFIDNINGEPYLEICPIRDEPDRCWPQPYKKTSSNVKEKKYSFEVYLDPNNHGSHTFKLYDKASKGKKLICSWVIK